MQVNVTPPVQIRAVLKTKLFKLSENKKMGLKILEVYIACHISLQRPIFLYWKV